MNWCCVDVLGHDIEQRQSKIEIDDRRNLHTEYPNQYQKDAQANVQKSLLKEYSELNTHNALVIMKQGTAQQVVGGGDGVIRDAGESTKNAYRVV